MPPACSTWMVSLAVDCNLQCLLSDDGLTLRLPCWTEDTSLPVRHLDNFQLYLGDDDSSFVPLEDVDGITENIMAQGELIPDSKGKPGMSRLQHAQLLSSKTKTAKYRSV